MSCPICNDKKVVHHGRAEAGSIHELGVRPCPRCRPEAPGRILKALPDETLEGEALAKALTE